jgi:hypothetical protein
MLTKKQLTPTTQAVGLESSAYVRVAFPSAIPHETNELPP